MSHHKNGLCFFYEDWCFLVKEVLQVLEPCFWISGLSRLVKHWMVKLLEIWSAQEQPVIDQSGCCLAFFHSCQDRLPLGVIFLANFHNLVSPSQKLMLVSVLISMYHSQKIIILLFKYTLEYVTVNLPINGICIFWPTFTFLGVLQKEGTMKAIKWMMCYHLVTWERCYIFNWKD